MKKEILNEINEMRIKMGLKVLNEESILLSESIVGILEKTVVKSLRDLEKGLIKKFITGRLSDVEKNELKLFLKGDEGKEFISSLKAAVKDETDFGKKMVYNNWIKNRLETFAASEIKQAVPSSLSGKGSVRGKDTNPFANIYNQLSRRKMTTPETPDAPDFSGVLKSEAEAIFGITGKKMSAKQAEILNNASKNLLRLNDVEILKVEKALKEITGRDGLFSQVRGKLVNAKDTVSKQKLAAFDNSLSQIIGYLNIATKNTKNINYTNILKTVGGVIVLAMVAGIYGKLQKTKLGQLVELPELPSMDFLSSEDTQKSEPTKTKPDNSNNQGKTYQGIDDNGNPIFK
jgi:hypothetical protein